MVRSVISLAVVVLLWSWPWLLDWLCGCGAVTSNVHLAALGKDMREYLGVLKEICARLVVASGCGVIIGLERKSADRPAGLRSMTLVAMGSALYTLAVTYGINSGDPSRAAAQVCTGVGFIGAGVIAKGSSARDPVRGVTTACAVWVSAALGVVAASGLWMFAVYATGMSVTVLRISRRYNAIVRESMTLIGFPASSNRLPPLMDGDD